MKKLLFLLLLSSSLFSQKLTKPELVDKLTEETCECAKKEEITKENWQVTIGGCLITSTSKYNNDVKKHFGDDFLSNKETMTALGREIGKKMVKVCPKTMGVIIDGLIENKSLTKDVIAKEIAAQETEAATEVVEIEPDPTIIGTFVATKIDGFLYITIKEASGKVHQLALVNNFDNAFLIIDKVLKPNQKVEVTYFDGELYNAKTNNYINIKVLTDIKKL